MSSASPQWSTIIHGSDQKRKMSQRNDSVVCLPCLLMTLVSRNLQFTLHQNPLLIGSVARNKAVLGSIISLNDALNTMRFLPLS